MELRAPMGKYIYSEGDKTRNGEKNQKAKKTHKTQKWGSCNGEEATWCSLEQNREEDRQRRVYSSDKVSGGDGETRDTPRQLMELLQ